MVIGTKDGDYDKIPNVYLDPPGPGLILSGAGISLSKIFGVTANFTRGKKDCGLRTSSEEQCYWDIVEKMSQWNVLLYDHGEKRGWLVDACSALLHLLRFHVAHYRPILENKAFRLQNFQYADSMSGPDSAREVLLKDAVRQMVLLRDGEQTAASQSSVSSGLSSDRKTSWTIEDRVRDFWELFEKMHDTWSQKKAADGVKLDCLSSKLEGWKFQDVVRRQGVMKAVAADLDSEADDWLPLVREIDAIVLIGNGFGEIMKPTNGICASWKTVPSAKYCVAIQMSRLKSIIQEHGNPGVSPVKLAKDVFWPIIEHPFQCQCGAFGSGRRPPCSRNQVLRSGFLGTPKGLAPNELLTAAEYEHGAVIFGGRKLRKREPQEVHDLNLDSHQAQSEKPQLWQRVSQKVQAGLKIGKKS